jgi:peptide deformylase
MTPILQAGEPVLRAEARSLSPQEILSPVVQDLIARMREIMQGAPGVGLAAPQIGHSIQLAVIEDRAEYHARLSKQEMEERGRRPVPFHAIVNPKLLLEPGDPVEFFEGCLSLSGFTAIVPRAARVTVECLDETAQPRVIEAEGWYARILQHEVDHLAGTLYIDRMRTRSFASAENYEKYWRAGAGPAPS